MKKIKLLLTIPALACAIIPLVSCNRNGKQDISITLKSDKTQKSKTEFGAARFVFLLSAKTDITNISYKLTNVTKSVGCEVQTKLTLDGTELHLDVAFTNPSGSDYYKFDVEFTIFDKKTTIDGLTAIYYESGVPLPEKAFIIEDGELKGLSSEFVVTEAYTSLIIPDQVTSIKDGAFKNTFTTDTNPSIKTIILNNNLTSIGANAFDGCNAIESLDVSEIPLATVCPVSIGKDAFANWNSNGTITYKINANSYNALDCALCDASLGIGWFETTIDRELPTTDFIIEGTTLSKVTWDSLSNAPKHMTLVNTLTIPSNITAIGNNAFSKDEASLLPTNVTTLSMPEGLLTIGDYAFDHTSLNTFVNDINTSWLVTPSTLTSIGQAAFRNTKMEGMVFTPSVTTIKDAAFYGCANNLLVDVTQLDSIPSGWSTVASTFNFGSATTGWVYCKPAIASQWQTYFTKAGVEFGENKWYIKEDVVIVDESIVKPYNPAVQPLSPGYEYDTKALVLSAYRNHLTYAPILIDDIIYTIHDNVGQNFKYLGITVSSAKYSESDYYNTKILYNAILTSDPNTEYSGVIDCSMFNIEDPVNAKVEPDTTSGIMKFKFKNFLGTQVSFATLSIKEIATTGGQSSLKKYEYDYTTPINDVTENELGKVISKLGMFVKEDGNVYFNINSHYMGNCWIKQ